MIFGKAEPTELSCTLARMLMDQILLLKVYQYFKKVSIHFVVWFLAFIFWGLMRQFGHELVDGPDLGIGELVLIYAMLAVCAGIVFASVDVLLPTNFSKRTSFGKAVLFRTAIYFVIFIFLVVLGISAFTFFDEKELSLHERYRFIYSKEMLLLLFYCSLVVFHIHFVRELDRKFGKGNLLKMLLGSFHKPKEEDRVFMFLDLKSSTSIAEKLGHLKYSQMIQDCFLDLEAVFEYKAEVYQYVGDEVVLTWTKESGVAASNCLSAFFNYRKRLKERSNYYKARYDVIPQFKAGLNVGQIVVAEVGEKKREIAYHGDTINTAARIQSECGTRGEEILISRALFELVSQDDRYDFKSKGEVQLKGKLLKTEIYSVKEKED
ncbi:adenylate/guanylate cyclase domain-containing protein [Fulvivirgaceae bacterium BMA10]|uniref:Adenylate/guanylate cyclase domain-containing protein n=1 Tax=Splendidivirga corallicola TaxID=3051826 RepID=A0ABT8KLV4_9BACT|nr:adenylate/guanylate cyclase domain-containing protein [Fulvivirgaceae bacterium BMA10]